MRNDLGMTAVESSVVLTTLSLLFVSLLPPAVNFIDEAKMVKAKSDIETIGVAGLSRLIYDLGPSCLQKNSKLPCEKSNKVRILFGDGQDVTVQEVEPEDFEYFELDRVLIRKYCGDLVSHRRRRDDDPLNYAECVRNHPEICIRKKLNWHNDDLDYGDSMESQFNLNNPGYPTSAQRIYNGPGSGQGWRGAYLGGPFTDPWGKKYLVNTIFIAPPTDIDTCGICDGSRVSDQKNFRWQHGRYFGRTRLPNCKGDPLNQWSYDTFVISAGPNGLFETPFAVDGTSPLGDDIIYVVDGSGV